MNKKNVLFLSALSITLITGNTLAASFTFSPFTDYLTMHFMGASGTDFVPYYQPDNSIDIAGSYPLPSQDATITISSTNRVELGNPALSLFYMNGARGASCTMIFVDGPWSILNFSSGHAPISDDYNCGGLTISPITQIGVHQYKMTIMVR